MTRNAGWTLFSLGAPMLVALAAIPALIRTLGADRFGIVTLSWLLIGYCSLFDLGLGRALTKVVSEKFGGERDGDRDSGLAGTVWTALVMMSALGCVGGAIFAAASGWLAHSVLKVPPELQAETGLALRWVAVAIPLVTVSAGLRGVLEARQRFAALGILRTITGVLTFTGPLAAARFHGGLPAVIFTLAALRLLTLVAHAVLCVALAPEFFIDRTIRARAVGPLFRFGGWLTVSGLISPLMVSMDRFLIGIFLSMTSVAYYATPFEIVTKLKVIPAAIATVLFPALTSSLANDPARARRLFNGALYAVLGIVTPLTILVVVFARPGLRLWLGDEFAAQGYRPLQLLAIGVLINSAADVATSLLHASGRPDVNAKLHMIEFVLYVPLVCWMIRSFGIDGAALAWVLRVTFDAALLFWMAGRSAPAPKLSAWETVPGSCR